MTDLLQATAEELLLECVPALHARSSIAMPSAELPAIQSRALLRERVPIFARFPSQATNARPARNRQMR